MDVYLKIQPNLASRLVAVLCVYFLTTSVNDILMAV